MENMEKFHLIITLDSVSKFPCSSTTDVILFLCYIIVRHSLYEVSITLDLIQVGTMTFVI